MQWHHLNLNDIEDEESTPAGFTSLEFASSSPINEPTNPFLISKQWVLALGLRRCTAKHGEYHEERKTKRGQWYYLEKKNHIKF